MTDVTLAIDPVHGAHYRIAYAESTRKNSDDAICDLRSREGTVLRFIGAMFLDGSRLQGGDEATLEAIRVWAREKKFDVVVWTAGLERPNAQRTARLVRPLVSVRF